jgi:hypothetical protein
MRISIAIAKSTSFRVETEGHLLDGSEVKVYTDDDSIHQEFSHGQNDNIWSINEILSTKMLLENHPGIGEEDIEFNGDPNPVMGAVATGSIIFRQPTTF